MKNCMSCLCRTSWFFHLGLGSLEFSKSARFLNPAITLGFCIVGDQGAARATGGSLPIIHTLATEIRTSCNGFHFDEYFHPCSVFQDVSSLLRFTVILGEPSRPICFSPAEWTLLMYLEPFRRLGLNPRRSKSKVGIYV